MWEYNNTSSLGRGRRPYTVTPGTAHRIDYHPNYVPAPKPITDEEKALQRVGSSSLPLGYYTTRRVIPQSSPAAPSHNYFYGYQQQPSQPGYATYPEPQRGLEPLQQGQYNKQYNSPVGNRSMSAVSVLQQPKQGKQAPVQKRIERKTKRDSVSAQSTSSSSLQNYKPKSVSEDANPAIQIDDGFDDPIYNQNNEKHSESDSQDSTSDKEKDTKFDTVRSNKSGGSSVRFSNKPLHIEVPDYRGNDSSTSTDSDKASGSYHGSIPQDSRHDYPKVDPPTYSSVLKGDKNTVLPEIHAVKYKDEEPVYSTISEKKDTNTSNKEPPKRNLSVLDELKQRFASKLNLKSRSSEENGNSKNDNDPHGQGSSDVRTKEIQGATQTSSSTDVSVSVPNTFNPEVISPPLPPPPPPLPSTNSSNPPRPPAASYPEVVQPSSVPVAPQPSLANSTTAPRFLISAPPPPPPNFLPPPPPSQLTSSSKDNILPVEQIFATNSENQPGAAIATTSDKQDIRENSNNQKNTGSSQDNSGSESSSQIESDTDSQGSSSENEIETGQIKSILKNRDERPLVDPDKVTVYSESDEEDDTLVDKQTSEVPNSENSGDSSMDRKGVGFTRDTLDNEGTGKQYEKEGVNLSDIYKGKISSKTAIAKPNPIYDENDIQLQQAPMVQPREEETTPSRNSSGASTPDDKDVPNHIYDRPKSILKTSNGGSTQNLENIGNGGQPKSILKSSESKNKLPDIVTNGDVPNKKNSVAGPKSPTLSGSLSQTSEMYYSLKRRPDNISVINITQDGEEGDNISIADVEVFKGNSLQRNGFNMDTMRSNYSTGTMRTTISLGSAGDLTDVQITPNYYTSPSPGNDNFAFAYPPISQPSHQRPDKVLSKKSHKKDKKKTKSSKSKKQKETPLNNPNTTLDKKTTFADQALGFEAQIVRAKNKRRNQKIIRITSFVLVVLLIIIGTVVTIYFLTANDSPEVNTTTAPGISG